MSNSENRPVSVGNWILTFIILGIPLLNIIMLVVWAVGGTTHPSKKTFAQAYFVILAIAVCIGILVAIFVPGIVHHHHPARTAV